VICVKKRGYYEKKIEELEKELKELKSERQLLCNQDEGAKKILVSPFVLQKLIKEEEHKNKKILSLEANSQEETYAETKGNTITGRDGKSNEKKPDGEDVGL